MRFNKTALERAFELARSGKYTSITHLKRDIASESYLKDQLEGFSLARQLRELIAAARANG